MVKGALLLFDTDNAGLKFLVLQNSKKINSPLYVIVYLRLNTKLVFILALDVFICCINVECTCEMYFLSSYSVAIN